MTTTAAGSLASLVVVTCRSSAVLPACAASFRREAAAAGLGAEVVVVDHSEDPGEVRRLHELGADVVEARPNRGYAAGLNRGARLARGDLLLLANPDIELLPGSLAGLVTALDRGYAVAGPQLVWDARGPVFLPPPEDPAPASEVRRCVLRRREGPWRRAMDHELARLHALWSARGAAPVPSLRGPLMALRRPTWERLGPLDERYFLYYEETDWLWRAVRGGARLALVGDAHVVHRWGHAASAHPHREALETSSRRRFRAAHYRWWWRLVLASLERYEADAGVRAEAVSGPDEVDLPSADLHLLSPFAHLMPAAGWLGTTVAVHQIGEMTSAGRWYLAAARHNGRQWTIERSWTWEAG